MRKDRIRRLERLSRTYEPQPPVIIVGPGEKLPRVIPDNARVWRYISEDMRIVDRGII